MNDIKSEYLLLFNAITEAKEKLKLLENYLLTVQQQAEELFISNADNSDYYVINLSNLTYEVTR